MCRLQAQERSQSIWKNRTLRNCLVRDAFDACCTDAKFLPDLVGQFRCPLQPSSPCRIQEQLVQCTTWTQLIPSSPSIGHILKTSLHHHDRSTPIWHLFLQPEKQLWQCLRLDWRAFRNRQIKNTQTARIQRIQKAPPNVRAKRFQRTFWIFRCQAPPAFDSEHFEVAIGIKKGNHCVFSFSSESYVVARQSGEVSCLDINFVYKYQSFGLINLCEWFTDLFVHKLTWKHPVEKGRKDFSHGNLHDSDCSNCRSAFNQNITRIKTLLRQIQNFQVFKSCLGFTSPSCASCLGFLFRSCAICHPATVSTHLPWDFYFISSIHRKTTKVSPFSFINPWLFDQERYPKHVINFHSNMGPPQIKRRDDTTPLPPMAFPGPAHL